MLTHERIDHVAGQVLSVKLDYGFRHSSVVDDLDFDSVEAVKITAHFWPGAEPAGGSLVLAALKVLRATLRQQGEKRFAFLRYAYPDDFVQ